MTFFKNPKNVSYKEIERSRNCRLWIQNVIVPLAPVAIAVFTNDRVQDYILARVAYTKLRFNTWRVNRKNRKKQPRVVNAKFTVVED